MTQRGHLVQRATALPLHKLVLLKLPQTLLIPRESPLKNDTCFRNTTGVSIVGGWIYARHHCTTVLTCKGYKALTARDAALAKAAKGRPRNSPVASFSADPLEETSPSAAGT